MLIIVKALGQDFKHTTGEEDTFLKLFPHRYDYIYAPHPDVSDRPQWQTESRHPLSDRLIEQGAYLYGVRFGAQTQYCLLDIDADSAYHPSHDPWALSRIVEALELLGLVSYIACTSSYSQGLHLYFPFEQPQHSWQLAIAVTTLLESQGFQCQPGQLEVFPNPKLYAADGTPNLFNAHRLPLQAGSYLLNDQLEPVRGRHEAFADQWHQCQRRNAIDGEVIEQVLRQSRRQRHHVSQRADKFLNDLNAEIEAGWTGKGQTNYLLGRITMRTYIFHHVMQGGLPLSGDALASEIVSVATALPGYLEWCGHQHEIHQRVSEWARCIENSHYFPYGAQHGKYKAKSKSQESGALETTWNEQRSLSAQEKIQAAMADLIRMNQLPEGTTARFNRLVAYGIGGGTLYKYKVLWHPELWKTPQTPHPPIEREASAPASPATASYATSLFTHNDSNPLHKAGLSDSEGTSTESEGRNQEARSSWRQAFLDLKVMRSQQKQAARSQREAYSQVKAQKQVQSQAEKMIEYLQSGDPILVKEGLQWAFRQERSRLSQVLRNQCCDRPMLVLLLETYSRVKSNPADLCWANEVRRWLEVFDRQLG
ncbi:hypothetical protein PN498_14200 [Oscillatoria sp. CS-180]|uniref:hypothetical protein n=1 Tax=Oscillatoria sp. CS-180 TaxID=3021720 RepID=UPI00233118E5|nr:hypothetical protein [Oscillatoria sp. CS-180]MDB9527149.1 hypothetical protein [Oscillatoria sp. CS-180]